MVKLSLSSWLGSPSASSRIVRSSSDVERKKQNRRSFAGFGSMRAPSPTKINNHVAINGKFSEKAATNGVKEDGQQSMTALAETISRETAKLERYMKENDLPMPSFEVGAADDFPKLPEEIQRSRLEVMHATKQLRDLAVGPRESVRWGVWEVSLPAGVFVVLWKKILANHFWCVYSFWMFSLSRSSTTTT